MSSSQSEEQTMFLTREKKQGYVQSEARTIFLHVREKWYIQSKAKAMCEFRAKILAFYMYRLRRIS